jgi:putative ABC transport system substrate-binding protein
MIGEKTTMTIPVVASVGDPVAERLTTSLARPSGNITGLTVRGGWEIWGKRLSVLKEAVENLKQPRLLSKEFWWKGSVGHAVRQAAEQLGLLLAPAFFKGRCKGGVVRANL